jgi:cytochrome c-type biogenesis protein CcmH/NrfF
MAAEQPAVPSEQNPRRTAPRLSRTGLVLWLVAPVVIVILMAVLLDWSKARRSVEPGVPRTPAGAHP